MVDQRDTNSVVGTLALVIAIAALVIAWVAYNRQPGPDLEDRGARQLENMNVPQGIEEAAEKTEAVTRQGVGEAVETTGEAMEAGGVKTQEAGADIKTDDRAMQR